MTAQPWPRQRIQPLRWWMACTAIDSYLTKAACWAVAYFACWTHPASVVFLEAVCTSAGKASVAGQGNTQVWRCEDANMSEATQLTPS